MICVKCGSLMKCDGVADNGSEWHCESCFHRILALKKMSKYHSRWTKCNQNHNHQSKKEAQACDILFYLKKTGKIKKLQVQPKFELQPAFTNGAGKKVRAITYAADFSFFDVEQKRQRVVDIKGYRTKTYELKRKMFDYLMRDKGIFLEEEI